MKLIKSIFATAALAALATTAAHAQTTIRLTGSTAFRASTMRAIANLMNAGGGYKAAYLGAATNDIAAPGTGGDASGLEKCSIAILQGNITGANNPVTVKCFWSGSVTGVKVLTSTDSAVFNIANAWIDDSQLTSVTAGHIATVVTTGFTNFEAAARADITMSDSRQASTKYTTPSLNATSVGVVPFVWITIPEGEAAGIKNMTTLAARSVLSGATGASLAQFTGVNADSAKRVLMVGRNADSGTRLAALSETGYGTATNVFQFAILPSASTPTQAAFASVYLPETVLGDAFTAGRSGYGSGSTVIGAMKLTGANAVNVYGSYTTTSGVSSPSGSALATQSNNSYFVAYVGTSDAASLPTLTQDADAPDVAHTGTGIFTAKSGQPMQVLTYNGVQYSYANVREGFYTFWTNEFLMYRDSNTGSPSLSADGVTVAGKLATEIKTNTANLSGIKTTTMYASRSAEGAVVTRNTTLQN